MIEIKSLSNPKIKNIIKLRSKNKRDKNELFIIEGYRELFRAVKNNVKIESLFTCEEFFLKNNENDLIEDIKKQGSFIYTCSKDVFKKISYRDRPDGLVALAYKFNNTLETALKDLEKKDLFIVICENIEKPGNLGTILRSCDGSGVDLVLVCDPCTDIFNPNVVRSSVGTLFSQKVVQCSSKEAFSFLKKYFVKIVATTPSANVNYTDVDLNCSLAVVVGSEQYGLSDKWLKLADEKVKIPMLGIADSLNVATATTIMLYEVVRQKRSSLSR